MVNQRMLITDLDGTLLRSDGRFSDADIDRLRWLGERGVIRVLATGRSPYSFHKAVSERLPFDYVLFSTGAAIVDYKDGCRFLKVCHLSSQQAREVNEILCVMNLDFMVHDPFPDNHRFAYRGSGRHNPDFQRRIDRYVHFSRELDRDCIEPSRGREVSQFLVVVPQEAAERSWEAIHAAFPELSVIRSTSPLDHKSAWIEIFHPDVSKSRSAEWLCRNLGILAQDVLAIGNDYNDMDLLEWAGAAMLVENAPEALRSRFPTVASNNASGVSEAIEKWMQLR
ncbi:MAG: HAD family hydrolase [Thermodesulfobacteriota bacterium]